MNNAIIVVDLGFGDAGKGTMVDYYCRKYNITNVVRFNGGPQAAHHVVLPDGRCHKFSSFGSGTFAGAKTFLTKDVLIHPRSLCFEAEKLTNLGIKEPYKLININSFCKVITPYHVVSNHLIAKVLNHGSCGFGVGEVMQDLSDGLEPLYAYELTNKEIVRKKLLAIRKNQEAKLNRFLLNPVGLYNIDLDQYVNEYSDLGRTANINNHPLYGNAIFEGAQGVLLDEWHGFHPYTTWSTTTYKNAIDYIKNLNNYRISKVGVIRSYMVRHGNGVFPTSFEGMANLPHYRQTHNKENEWQGKFRTGNLDLLLLKYSLDVVGPIDGLCITHMDQLPEEVEVVHKYQEVDKIIPNFNKDLSYQEKLTKLLKNATLGGDSYNHVYKEDFSRFVGDALNTQVSHLSYGPTYSDKKELIRLI